MQAAGVDTPTKLAGWLGANESTVRNWHKRGNVPLEWVKKAAALSGKPVSWFIEGPQAYGPEEGTSWARPLVAGLAARLVEESTPGWWVDPKEGTPEPRSRGGTVESSSALLAAGPGDLGALTLSLEVAPTQQRKDYFVVSRLLGPASAGRGEPRDHPLRFDRAGDLVLSHEWLSRNLRHTSGKLTTVQVQGDSMSPTLIDGDTIIIDLGVAAVDVDGVYVIDMQGNRLVKRLQRKFDETIVVISDNAAYEKETIPRGRVREITVIGRMVWPRVR